jgi:two-component system, cell cycle sensor histidine kinase and response regulator CckA
MKTQTVEEIGSPSIPTLTRLLIVEDSPHDVDLVLFELREAGFRVRHAVAKNQEEFRAVYKNNIFDAVLSDFRLPGWTGLDVLEEIRAAGDDVPFLLVTGTMGEEAAVECIKQGVSDYILKGHLSRLPVALQRALTERALRQHSEKTQAALTQSEARARQQFAELDMLYRTAPICLAVLDHDLRYLRVNDALAANHRLAPVDFVGRRLEEMVPDRAAEAAEFYRKVFATGKPILNIEARVNRAYEPFEPRDYLASFYPLTTSEGQVEAACVVMVDVTDRKRAEEELHRSEARNRDLVAYSLYGICRASVDGSFLDANPALLRILGMESWDQLRDLNLVRDVFRFPEQFVRLLASCRANSQTHGAETEWRRRDGGIVAMRLHLRRFSLAGEPESIEIMAEDVTELRATERQLRQAQKFEAIGQLAGGIAHDFNNVIGAILGWAELGYDQNQANPQVAERFARIREQADRAAALTRELLAFARRQVLQPRPVDLNTITSGLMSFLDRVIGKDIELKVVTSAVDPVKADPTQIEQVLMNLCLNARDAMPSGGRLLIETEMVELDDSYCRFYPYVAAGRYVVLSVSDTGMGMDSETRERIFEPFFTTKEKGRGTGMGLATVYGILKQHSGFIHVYSEPGQGSLFRIYLPAMEGAVADGATSKTAAVSFQDIRGSETILIAEDHESVREMARQTLLGLGYRVLSAGDGEEAMALCKNETPALAVLDVVMPKLGGPATAARLAERFDGIPILFTSGYSQDSQNLSGTVPGTRYLQKPYSPTMLGRLIREILDRRP